MRIERIGDAVLYNGDCRDVIKTLPDNSIDSVVTDPPYALVSIQKRFGKPGSAAAKHGKDGLYARASAGFMGKQWDTGEVAFSDEFWAEVLRVLKPGGHVVAFSGTRTYHRMAVAIEDAGFEIRDQLGWLYGSGFPKSHNQHGDWEGWGTALKPAWEPIALARKPLDGTVAANLAKWGVGALNVDGCRVSTDENLNGGAYAVSGGRAKLDGDGREGAAAGMFQSGKTADADYVQPSGRWPANIVHDGSDEVLAGFPDTKSGAHSGNYTRHTSKTKNAYGERAAKPEVREGDSGSAARFFYCAKASRKDRDEGLEHLPKKAGGMVSNTSGQHITRRDEGYKPEPTANTHPTVKPTDLMRWLCRLVTPPGGVILDPFMGSGSTGKAALLEGFRFVGCEREDEYMPIAEARIRAALQPQDKKPAGTPVAAANDNKQADLFASTPAASTQVEAANDNAPSAIAPSKVAA